MKKYFFVMTAVLAVMASSCSKEETKVINPSDTSFSSGELGKYIEVVEQPSIVTCSKRESAFGGYLYDVTVPVTVRLKKEHHACSRADLQDIDFISLLCVATVQLQDANGVELHDADLADGQSKKLKRLLQGHAGDTVSVIFTGYVDEDKFESFVAYSPYLSADIRVETPDESSDDYSSSTDSPSSSSSSSDWDKILDDYEKFVNRYVAVLKKVNQGDMNAMSESAELMEEYMEFVEELDGASDEMTAAQAARYSRITMKVSSLM